MNEKILLVDDEVDFLDVLSEFLRDEGYVASTARNAQEALELLQSGKCSAARLVTHVFPLDKIKEAFEKNPGLVNLLVDLTYGWLNPRIRH